MTTKSGESAEGMPERECFCCNQCYSAGLQAAQSSHGEVQEVSVDALMCLLGASHNDGDHHILNELANHFPHGIIIKKGQ